MREQKIIKGKVNKYMAIILFCSLEKRYARENTLTTDIYINIDYKILIIYRYTYVFRYLQDCILNTPFILGT